MPKDAPLFYEFHDVQIMLRQEGFPVVVAGHRNPDQPLHAHDFIEIVTVNTGRGRHLLETGEQPLAVGDVFIIPRGIRHGYANEGGLTITNMLFQQEAVDRSFPEIREMPGFLSFFLAGKDNRNRAGRLLNLNAEELAHLTELQNRIRREQHSTSSGSTTMCLLLLAEILVYLSRLLETRPEKELSPEAGHPLLKIHDHLRRHYREKITIPQLAALACMSERNFQRQFTRFCGESPNRCLLRIRLEKARDLLKNTNWEISRIAAETGFQENAYLTRQFKKHFALSPTQYRQILTRRLL